MVKTEEDLPQQKALADCFPGPVFSREQRLLSKLNTSLFRRHASQIYDEAMLLVLLLLLLLLRLLLLPLLLLLKLLLPV